MHPIPCAHCGQNFMRHTLSQFSNNLCHNCLLREEKRNPKKEEFMETDTIDILIKCPRNIQKEMEEYCIKQGFDFSTYFLQMYHFFNASIQSVEMEEKSCLDKHNQFSETATAHVEKIEKNKGKKK